MSGQTGAVLSSQKIPGLKLIGGNSLYPLIGNWHFNFKFPAKNSAVIQMDAMQLGFVLLGP